MDISQINNADQIIRKDPLLGSSVTSKKVSEDDPDQDPSVTRSENSPKVSLNTRETTIVNITKENYLAAQNSKLSSEEVHKRISTIKKLLSDTSQAAFIAQADLEPQKVLQLLI